MVTDVRMKLWRLINLSFLKTSRYKMNIYRGVYMGVERGYCIIQTADAKLSLGKTHFKSRAFESSISLRSASKLLLNGAFDIYSGFNISINNNAVLELGTGYINTGAFIACFHHIKIGNDVVIAENVTIRDDDSHTMLYDGYVKGKPIEILDNVWIGMNVTILKGVTIGEGSIVAAGSIVTRDVPPNTLVAGAPAKVIKENISWL